MDLDITLECVTGTTVPGSMTLATIDPPHLEVLMIQHRNHTFRAASARAALLLAIGLSTFLCAIPPAATAFELIPSIGLTKAVDDKQGDAKAFGSLALRSPITPFFDFEVGIAYREQSLFGDQLKLRMWPVTASVWVRPIPTLYAGVGVGYYPVTFDYNDALNIENSTSDQFGIHVGAGASIPIAPKLGLDLNGRYVMLREEDSHLVPASFDPDFWNASVGLAIKF